MLPSTGELVLVSTTVLILLVSGWWTDQRYDRFAMLPAHYDIRGKATRMAPRTVMAWTIPVMFSVLLLALTFMIAILPGAAENDDALAAAIFSCVTMLCAQGFVLWLLARWAREQA